MKEFLEALSITLAFVLSGYVLFGGLGKTESSTETMDVGSMDTSGGDVVSMPGMNL